MRHAAARPRHRSDVDLFIDARDALDRAPAVPVSVRVHVNRGTATLTGTVRLVAESVEAESIVRRVCGVSRVVNEISVAQRPSAEGFEPPAGLSIANVSQSIPDPASSRWPEKSRTSEDFSRLRVLLRRATVSIWA